MNSDPVAFPRPRSRLPQPAIRMLLLNLNTSEQPYPVYPLGLAYLEGALRTAGHTTRVWDGLTGGESLEEAVAAFAPHLIGLSMRNVDNVQYHSPRSFVPEVVDCGRRLRACTEAPLVLGGSAFSVFPHELFELTGVEYGIQGEGEEILLRLIGALQTGAPLDDIAGLHFRSAAGVSQGRPPQPDDVVFTVEPQHDPALLRTYVARGGLPGVQTQRGCPLRCCYCTYPLIEGRRSRFRSSDAVVAEMRQLAALGVNYAFIVDSVFNTHAEHVQRICAALVDAKLDLQWGCFLRPAGATRELLALMQRAGLRHVEFGSDSFSDPVLQAYGKSFTFAEVRQASENAHALGLNFSHFLIFGGPGETVATVEETIERACHLPGAQYFATIGMRIYPETPLWRQLAPECRGETAADYLPEPRFFLAPSFTVQGLLDRLECVRRVQHNWIIGDPPPVFSEIISKLRRRGVRGPAWEYIELLQRLGPGAVPPTPARGG